MYPRGDMTEVSLQAALPPRVCEALHLCAEGLAEEEIARHMGVTVSCVRAHLSRARKMIQHAERQRQLDQDKAAIRRCWEVRSKYQLTNANQSV